LAKRLSEKQKEEIISSFKFGKTIDELSKEFNFTKLTITRNLKKKLGKKKYDEIINKTSFKDHSFSKGEKHHSSINRHDQVRQNHLDKNYLKTNNQNIEDELFSITPFMEITPLNIEIENQPQKDLSSVPISDISFPKIVYMIVDKKLELVTRYLKDFSEWNFLSNEELQRKTIQIYFDMKNAKRFCSNDQKVIKIPNTNVFKIVAPLLISRGISRIVSEEKLIAL
tara:strand:- start:2846 stop:3523 length:678 start_codon:yes stop_codon:yes gene_type:complete